MKLNHFASSLKGANFRVLHCSQTTCHCGWICFMEPCLGSDVYVHTFCIYDPGLV
jgi:hypothetical protein